MKLTPARRLASPLAPPLALPAKRFAGIDILRGAAIVMMIAYHFCFDLVAFGYANWHMLRDPGWIAWRGLILSSFLLLAGVSLVLRASFKPAWRDFWLRWWQIGGAALLVTAGSALVFPASFIYFGVLHHLALALIVARLMLGFGRWNALAGIAVLLGGLTISLDVFNPKWINWIGFVSQRPSTEDYVPAFPWLGMVLLGTALGHWWRERGFRPLWPSLEPRGIVPTLPWHTLAWLGRHSLSVYLVHQPIMMGALWLFWWSARHLAS